MPLDAALLERTLELPAAHRAELATQLLLSLEPPDYDADNTKLWAREFKARIARVQRGESKPMDWRKSAQRIRRSLRNAGK